MSDHLAEHDTPKATSRRMDGAVALVGLFAPPLTNTSHQQPPSVTTTPDPSASQLDDTKQQQQDKVPTQQGDHSRSQQYDEERRPTVVHSNVHDAATERTTNTTTLTGLFVDPKPPTMEPQQREAPNDQTPLLGKGTATPSPPRSYWKPTFSTTTATSSSTTTNTPVFSSTSSSTKFLHLQRIEETTTRRRSRRWSWSELVAFCQTKVRSAHSFVMDFTQAWTWIGGFMFLLYHTVFCLTMGSAVTRPNQIPSMLGVFTKLSAGGIVFGSPIYWILLGDIPALYPAADLFAAPFFADMALKVDTALMNDPTIAGMTDSEERNLVFLATFSLLAQISMIISGVLILLASVFKLANIGSFLPYSVLAGFFAAVAVLTWQLAFNIDANGLSVGDVLMSQDWNVVSTTLIHHAPSLATAALMYFLGPKHPFYVVGLVLASLTIFYTVLGIAGVSRQEAVEQNWFWGVSDLVYEPLNAPFGFKDWVIPAPLGWIKTYFFQSDYIHWGAVQNGMDTSIALAFLYLIRCSLHVPALRKNISNLVRPERRLVTERGLPRLSKPEGLSSHGRQFSESVDLEISRKVVSETDTNNTNSNGLAMVPAKPTNHSVKDIMATYGYSVFLCAFFGFLFITPNISISGTMYKLRAEKVAPQFLAGVLLLFFYLFDFRLVGYIPKTAFSSLLVLASINNFDTFVLKSYFRTKEKLEWLVVPLIVGLAFVVGLLEAVFLGMAISTFIFVASFFRSGVVKFISTGAVIRSTIERPPQSAIWLDENGSLIQVLVLQNYLFFGNSSSIMNYISSMFEEPEEEMEECFLPPLPKIVIMDLTLVSGIDTSAVDVFNEILFACSSHKCKLFIAGASTSLRKAMQLGGFTSGFSRVPSARKLRFFPDLDSAVGKAEDMLLSDESFEENSHHGPDTESGFIRALQHIDRQHQLSYSSCLAGLEPHTTRFSVEPGQILYNEIDVPRGLFFIEHGILKVEQNAHDTLTRSGSRSTLTGHAQMSLNVLKARSIPVTPQAPGMSHQERREFRVARIGPGWVLGTGESLTGMSNPGKYVAVTQSVVHYISFQKVEALEETEPRLSLKLQKLLSYLMAKRQSVTINQLATLHSIMSSPALKRPLSRRTQHGSFGSGGTIH